MAEEAGTLLLQFADGTLLTTEDVGNIEITYPLNEETDVTVGKCVSAELRCTVLNYHGLLSGYGFGRCSVSMGVMVGAEEWTMPACKAAVVHGYGTASTAVISAHEDAPFLRLGGSAASSQPAFAPDCLVLMGDTLYAGDGTNLWAATIDGSTLTAKAVDNDFLAYKLGQWSGRGISYQGKMAYEFTSDGVDKYEYVPLGTFYFNTPEQRRVANISCEALDGMQKFNVDVDDWWASLTWPLTRGQLLQSLCAHVGVTLKTTTFPGSTKSIASAPMAGNGLVGKDVLGWIAETACAYARMSRDDQLELVWFATQSVKLTQNQHFGDSPAEYETPAVQALHVMVANTDLGVMLPENGSGNEYQVLDNPFFYGSTEAEIRGKAQDLYNRLVAFPVYTPNSVDAVCDWAIEPGDIIQVVGGDGTTRTLPIFRMVLKWAGGWARATYECTGGTGRKPAPQSKRREFAAYRAYHKLEVDITGIKSEIGDVQGNVANLEITASELRTQINGKIDGTEAQSLIDQTVDKISLEVSSGFGGSSFVLKKDGVEISSDTLDLHVKSVNVDGDITANAINLSTANITGTLSAQFIDATDLHVNGANIDNLTVTNAMIDTLYASKIVGGSVGGYVPYGAISDASHYLSSLYATNAAFNAADIVTLNLGLRKTTVLTDLYVTTSTGSRSWESIVAGDGAGTAVFG
uniref:Uncharacterized protein n=1 Tax=Siphoviridae sp. ctdcr45 TaxID=2825580 RepID=A0A8S5Q8L6_9CAUD|nr:MAG TPA: hypothetical protein [Siphoviridae sp. ctdcr45]